MNRAPFVVALALGLLFAVPYLAAHAGEDPVFGIVTADGPGVVVGCVSVPESNTVAFQCIGCRVRYRLLTANEFAAGVPIPTDGGPMVDGGSWGPLVDFSGNPEPYRARTRLNQTKICFYAEDAGLGADGGHSGFTNRTEVYGLY